ncbi:hypothetical protein [Krasilnikovia sp. MM14-A1004]|uniref:hypothetical protein n=1 Tax=Krasilnikovia sp. MM14-A1004 TaxID=3373541 RepID=UPI00399CB946
MGILVPAALAGVLAAGPLAAPAWAKSDYELTVREKQVTVGQEIHVTVEFNDDAGIRQEEMCLFQMVGTRLPPRDEDGRYQTRVADEYRKAADCQAIAPHGTVQSPIRTEFVLRATAPGRLTLVAFRGNAQGLYSDLVDPEPGHPVQYIGTQPVTITVRGEEASSESIAKVSVVRVADAGRSTDPATDPDDAEEPEAQDAGVTPVRAQDAARPADPPGWLVLGAATAGGLLVGGAVTGTVIARRARRRAVPH